MTVKICKHCYTIFRGDLSYGVDGNKCPLTICGDGCPLVEIDDLLADVMVRLWKAGLETSASCSGHLHNRKYVKAWGIARGVEYYFPSLTITSCLIRNKEVPMEELKDICLDLAEQYPDVTADYREQESVLSLRAGDFNIGIPYKECLKEDDPKKFLDLQQQFVKFLYDLADILHQMWEGTGKKTGKKATVIKTSKPH